MNCDNCGKKWDGTDRFTTSEVEHGVVRTLCETCGRKAAQAVRDEQRKKKYTDPPPRW